MFEEALECSRSLAEETALNTTRSCSV